MNQTRLIGGIPLAIALLKNVERHARHGRESAFKLENNDSLFVDYFQAILDDVERIEKTLGEI